MRLNPLNGRWVTIVAERAERPSDFAPRQSSVDEDPSRPCPFCPGHEEATPPALETVDLDGTWSMRVIPNRYPAFDGEEAFAVHNLGPVFVMAEASGIHEVFVYTPDHHSGLHLLDDDHAAQFMRVLRDRFADHAATPQVRYTQAIVNHGREAGASVAHPHGQILGLPFVPGEILDEERAFARFAGGCLLCTTVEAELAADERVVFATDDVAVITPYWSGAPYELLIVPRHHEPHLQDAPNDSLESVGRALRDALGHLNAALGDVAFNLGFHTAPHQHTGQYHWHAHVWPNLVTQAGFERGTGVMINIVPPEQACDALRSVAASGLTATPHSRPDPTSRHSPRLTPPTNPPIPLRRPAPWLPAVAAGLVLALVIGVGVFLGGNGTNVDADEPTIADPTPTQSQRRTAPTASPRQSPPTTRRTRPRRRRSQRRSVSGRPATTSAACRNVSPNSDSSPARLTVSSAAAPSRPSGRSRS